MNKLPEKITLDEALRQDPKTLFSARQMLQVLRENFAPATASGPTGKNEAISAPELSDEQRRNEHARRERVIAEARASNERLGLSGSNAEIAKLEADEKTEKDPAKLWAIRERLIQLRNPSLPA